MEIFASYTGTDFLVFYCLMLATCVLAGLWIPANLRPLGRRGEISQAEEMAVLAGGQSRHAETVAADLLARGGLSQGEKGKLRASGIDIETGSAGRSLMRKSGEFSLKEISGATAIDAETIEERLVRQGLVMSKGERSRLRLLSVLPYGLLILIGLYRQQAGSALGEPTGLLVVLMVITAVCAAIRFFTNNPRTVGGNQTLLEAEASSSRLKRAPQANEAGYAVAIFGTAVLVGTPWEPVHAARQAASGADSGHAGDSDSGDGGGGCGGGCGGCGG